MTLNRQSEARQCREVNFVNFFSPTQGVYSRSLPVVEAETRARDRRTTSARTRSCSRFDARAGRSGGLSPNGGQRSALDRLESEMEHSGLEVLDRVALALDLRLPGLSAVLLLRGFENHAHQRSHEEFPWRDSNPLTRSLGRRRSSIELQRPATRF